jgi:hypothetical protein
VKTIALHNPLRRGADVRKLQELLNKRGFHCHVDGVFGPHTAELVIAAKRHYHYPSREVLPTAGDQLFHILETDKSPFHKDPLHHSVHHTNEMQFRNRIVEYALWAIEHNRDIHYAEIRPMELLDELKRLPWTGDCSTFVTRCYKAANMSDPNGLGYNGQGYTGTLLNHLRHITVAQVKPADVMVYGSYPGHHTALVIGVPEGKLPTIATIETASHGGEHGPLRITVAEEMHYQPPGLSCLTAF